MILPEMFPHDSLTLVETCSDPVWNIMFGQLGNTLTVVSLKTTALAATVMGKEGDS
jgi:hypothetical protein